jgi:hypothetical protein
MSVTPDFAGFEEGQRRLLKTFGRDVRFYGPAAVIYDSGIPSSAFDDEGIPLDPLASGAVQNEANVELAGLTVVASAHCNVVFKPLQTSILRRDQSVEQEIGLRSGLNRDLILNPEDAVLASGATHFQIGTFARDDDGDVIEPEQWTPDTTRMFRISETAPDTFGPVQRFIVYGQVVE